ncbi:MAG: hypothetical protein M1831_007142 [Alyxoria varia]|nr:MAG: hypothetical protein M1831_007142 [Alyxoria varia]
MSPEFKIPARNGRKIGRPQTPPNKPVFPQPDYILQDLEADLSEEDEAPDSNNSDDSLGVSVDPEEFPELDYGEDSYPPQQQSRDYFAKSQKMNTDEPSQEHTPPPSASKPTASTSTQLSERERSPPDALKSKPADPQNLAKIKRSLLKYRLNNAVANVEAAIARFNELREYTTEKDQCLKFACRAVAHAEQAERIYQANDQPREAIKWNQIKKVSERWLEMEDRKVEQATKKAGMVREKWHQWHETAAYLTVKILELERGGSSESEGGREDGESQDEESEDEGAKIGEEAVEAVDEEMVDAPEKTE